MNEIFLERMKNYLKDEYDSYLQTLDEERYRGLRVNTAKISTNDFESLNVCEMSKSDICKESYYIPGNIEKLGNHVFHLAGLFYMQEPSASSAVEILGVKEGDWVLDLCAAPGGKSTQIAAKLKDTGFLVSNEIDHKRANILLSNLERMGVSENMITNAHPEIICQEMKGMFDKVLVDAPCSGEGMFKKHEKAMEDWSEEHVVACSQRQLHILDSAYLTLKENGILVYSTCTYSIEENEHVVYEFLKKYPDMELIDCDVKFGRCGIEYKELDISKVRRILPMDKGEGHFIAKFKRNSPGEKNKLNYLTNDIMPNYVKEFLNKQLVDIPKYCFINKDKIYMKHSPFIQLKKTRILRQGIYIGELVKQRIEPVQHFYVCSSLKYKNICELTKDECNMFLKGEMLNRSGFKGFVQLTYMGYPIGFGKGDGTVIKNKYPKGLRLKGDSI